MKKDYMKPAIIVEELQHETELLQTSSLNKLVQSGFDETEDELDLSNLGGDNSICDR